MDSPAGLHYHSVLDVGEVVVHRFREFFKEENLDEYPG